MADDDWKPTGEVVTGIAAPTASEWSITSPAGANTPDKSFTGSDVGNLAAMAANSATFGMANRASALGAAARGKESYSEALARLHAKDEEMRAKHPWTSTGSELAGGAANAASLIRAGILRAAPAGATLARQAFTGGAQGLGLGALQGAGTTYSGIPADYFHNAGMGGILGAGVGAVAPAIGAVGGQAYRAAADRGMFGGIPKALADAGQADAAGLRNLPNIPGAMLPDAGPSMTGVAQGARSGAATGPGKTALTENLTNRNTAQGQRITGDIDRTFGPAGVPEDIAGGVRERMGGLGPQYEAALNNARAIDNTGLARELETRIINSRGPDQAALRQVRAMLDIPTNPGNLDPHPRALQAAREAVRGMMQAEENPSVRGQLEHVYRRMTQELQAKVPGIRQIDSQYAELGAQERAAQTGSQGSRIFQTDRENVVRPTEAQRIMTETAQPKGSNVGPSAEPFRFREATRNELDRIVGTNRHDLAALERILGQPQDWNSEKLATVFGADRAAALRAVLERERTFANTFQDVVKGPQTADRLLAAKALDAGEGKIPLDTTLTGALSRGVQAAGQALRSGASASNRDRIAALMATQDPVELQRLVQQILATNPGRDTTQRATREAIARMMSGAPALAPQFTNR